MKTYVVKVYRQDLRKNPQKIVGVVEEVGMKGKMGFTNLEELWEILTPAESTPGKSRRAGNHVSGKYGIEKRGEVRIKKDLPVALFHEERSINALTMNVSKNGLGIKIPSNVSLPVGDIVNLKVNGLDVKARVMWVNAEPNPPTTRAGFKILNGRLSLN